MNACSKLRTLAVVLGPWLWASSALADEPRTQTEGVIHAGNCVLEYGQHAVIGVNIFGTIKEIKVREGERVRTGQVLGRLRDDDLRADFEVAKADAANMASIRQYDYTYQQNKLAVEVNKKVAARNTALVSALEMGQAVMLAESSRWQMEEAKFTQRLSRLKRDAIEAQILLKAFVCPHDGIVVELMKRPGESCAVNDPVMRVANTDFFRVTGAVDLEQSWRAKAGQKVRLRPDIEGSDLPIEREVFEGKLVFVDRQIDTATQTCRILAEVKNRGDLLRAGLKVRMEIIEEAEPAAGPSGPRKGRAS